VALDSDYRLDIFDAFHQTNAWYWFAIFYQVFQIEVNRISLYVRYALYLLGADSVLSARMMGIGERLQVY